MSGIKRKTLKWTREAVLRNYSIAPNGCWIWLGPRCGAYGSIWLNRVKTTVHRIALEAKLGRPIKERHCACHACDNPICINPDHLFEGSFRDNIRDALVKGRVLYGDAHPDRVLNAGQAREILSSTCSESVLAERYGVTRSTIASLRQRRSWKYLFEEPKP